MQLLDAFGPRFVGLHTSKDTVGATRLTFVLAELLLYVAAIVALELLVTVVVVPLKVADVAPAATVTDAGTVSAESLLVNVTLAPPLGAAPLSVTVQVELIELLMLAGLQDRELTVGKAPPVTVPPVDERAMLVPEGDAATPPLIWIAVAVRSGAIVRFTTATVPFEMIAEFMADTRHLYVPLPGKQFSVLEALMEAVPGVAEIETTLAAG